jgi:hypothetical protein
VRPQADLERLLGRAYRGEIDLGRLAPGLRVLASALDERNLCLAQIAAVQMRVPDLPDEIARRDIEAEDLLIKTERGDGDRLARGGWDSAEHPRAGVPPNRGWFAPTDGDGADSPTEVAQGEEDERAPEEMLDPTAPPRQAQWDAATATLRQLDPSNPQLSYIVGPNWVPSNQDIAEINAEIRNVVIRRVTNSVMPGGKLIGEQGGNVDVRILQGGMQAAEHASII